MSRNAVKSRWLVSMLALGCGPAIANDGDETTGDADTTTTTVSSSSTGPTSADATTSTSDDSNPS